MIYVFDANVLINAARDFYPIDRVPDFWLWLDRYMADGQQDQIKTIRPVLDEATASPGPYERESARWLRDRKDTLLIPNPAPRYVRTVWTQGYEQVSTPEVASTDALLIATALADPGGRVVVTMENAQRNRRRGRNRHVPHVCGLVGVQWLDFFELLRRLDFRTPAGRRREQLRQP